MIEGKLDRMDEAPRPGNGTGGQREERPMDDETQDNGGTRGTAPASPTQKQAAE